MKTKTIIKRALRLVFDMLFPVYCLGCKTEETWLCNDCQNKIEKYNSPEDIKLKNIKLIVIGAKYQGLIRKAIHCFKYKGVKDLAKPLAKILPTKISTKAILIPVPLHKSKLRIRGYNQAKLIAHEISKKAKCQINTSLLWRQRKTKSQMKLNKEDRQKNITQAFALKNPQPLKNQEIWLVDDVLTSGATLEECAKVLQTANPKSIQAIVLAHEQT